jgi:hypothetical protein
MTQATAVQVKNAKRLRPFDQEDKDFFAEFSDKTIGEKISDLQDVYASLNHQLVGIFREYFDKGNISQARVVARTARNLLRDIKHYELALTKHLEQIEVTGEWK